MISLPPWYRILNDKLEGSEWFVDWALLAVIAVTILLLAKGDRVTKSTWLIYLALP
jgi:hypothetical protein